MASQSGIRKFLRLGKKIFRWVCLLAILATVEVQAAVDPLIVSPGFTRTYLGAHAELLEDPSGLLTIDEIAADTEQGSNFDWFTQDYIYPELGFTTSAYWTRFTIRNEYPHDMVFYLQLGNPLLDDIEVYYPKPGGGFDLMVAGALLPFDSRPVKARTFTFPVRFPAGADRTIYVRVTTSGPFVLPFSLNDVQFWVDRNLTAYHSLGFIYGAMGILVFYNIFVFFSVRKRAHLYLVFYVLTMGLFTLSTFGLGTQYFWPNAPWISKFSTPLSFSLSTFFFILFNRAFLDTRNRTPRLDWFIKGLLTLGLGIVVLSVFAEHFPPVFEICDYFSEGVMTLLLPTSFYFLWRRKYLPARFLVLGAIAFLLHYHIHAIVPDASPLLRTILKWTSWVGPWVQALFMSLALADQINLIKRGMIQAKDQALDKLKATDKLKDDILANTTHELLTPLNGIVGLSGAMLRGRDNQQLSLRQTKTLKMIQQSGRRLTNLIGDILDFSRVRDSELVLNMQPVDLSLLVEDVLAMCASIKNLDSLRLFHTLPPDLPWVLADEARLQQILFNLVGNAVKFTDEGEVQVLAEQSGDRVKIGVRDTGIGIPEDKLDSIFGSFQQADASISRQYGGTGLGLSITRKLVRLHDGNISIDSELNQGTTIWFDLEVAHEGVSSAAAVQPGQTSLSTRLDTFVANGNEKVLAEVNNSTPKEVADGLNPTIGQRTILVVDDEPVNLHLLQETLQAQGYQVVAAQNGPQALKYFSEESPDLVVLDLMMPKMSGYDVCLKMRELDPPADLPILILTARRKQEDLVRAFDCGANDFLTKPFYHQELIARVNSLIGVKELSDAIKEKEMLQAEVVQKGKATKRMASILESTGHGVITVDKSLQVSYMSSQAEAMFGVSFAESPELSVSSLFSQSDLEKLNITPDAFEDESGLCTQVRHTDIHCLSSSGNGFEAGVLTSLVKIEDEIFRVINLFTSAQESAALNVRQAIVTVMRLALECWNIQPQKDKVDLADESGLWTVYLDRSTPTTRTLDKYLHVETLPMRPRFSQVFKTGEFVLDTCPDGSRPYQALTEALRCLHELLVEDSNPGREKTAAG